MLIGVIKVDGTNFTLHVTSDHAGDLLQEFFHAGSIMEKSRDLTDITNKLGMIAFDEHGDVDKQD